MSAAIACTCAGTAPGYPQHEDWCGLPELDCLCGYGFIGEHCPEHAHLLNEPIPFELVEDVAA